MGKRVIAWYGAYLHGEGAQVQVKDTAPVDGVEHVIDATVRQAAPDEKRHPKTAAAFAALTEAIEEEILSDDEFGQAPKVEASKGE